MLFRFLGFVVFCVLVSIDCLSSNLLEFEEKVYVENRYSSHIGNDLKIGIYFNPLKESSKEILLDIEDRRKLVDAPLKWPNSIHGQLNVKLKNDFEQVLSGQGSCFMVGPHHLLTAAHCVYGENGWVESAAVSMCLSSKVSPFGEVRVAKVFIPKKWKESSDKNFDFALIILEESIGNKVGWGSLICEEKNSLLQRQISVTGYPWDKKSKLMTMSSQPKLVEQYHIFYDIDTNKGQSGSAIWFQQDGNPHVVGIHTNGANRKQEGNFGVRLERRNLKFIRSLIFKTYHIRMTKFPCTGIPYNLGNQEKGTLSVFFKDGKFPSIVCVGLEYFIKSRLNCFKIYYKSDGCCGSAKKISLEEWRKEEGENLYASWKLKNKDLLKVCEELNCDIKTNVSSRSFKYLKKIMVKSGLKNIGDVKNTRKLRKLISENIVVPSPEVIHKK